MGVYGGMEWQALLTGATNTFMTVKPFLAATVIIAALVMIGDRGSRFSLQRNSPCMAALCIFAFAIGTGLTTWYLLLAPIFALSGVDFAITYPLVMMYWASWLLMGVLISAKKLVYDGYRRQQH